ncbi:SulP family inorganic anion transporter [Sideroxydans lithotrophicus]|uniref:Sulfate transporter n=1 Tax=Sideroxydans lithotrophicus (strain ES-1) TaxID=580332 RepID=D5CSK5_SIDLE|nr:SulP family inorganic anion transporter [Sideroxydans lithotrophicus]ADE11941.1 sulfate transporter [Sideroxydans lithotrophicus ES-1]
MNLRAYWGNFASRFDFHSGTLKADLIAGITVSLVAIPQSLAYAQLAGVPAYYGLYAALIPTVIGALFGSSNQLSTGPVAMTSLLTAASIAPLAAHGSDLFYSYAILLALISGLFQIAFGVLRIGVLLNFLSNPVLMGFINAAALIIGLSQLPTLLGIPAAQSQHFLLDISRVLLHIDTAHELSIGFGVAAILLLLGFKKFAPRLPGVLITVASLTWLSYMVGYANLGGRVVGVVPEGLPTVSLPPLDWHATMALLPASFVIALISFMEAMSSCKVIAIKTRQPWDENKELIGQGLAKVAAAFSQSMPVSGSFSRSALNLASDARTPLSSIISAVFVLLTLIFFTSLLYHLPKPVLAAIIMMAVMNLVNFESIRNAWRANRDDGLAAIVTFIATLAFAPNIQNGILTGIILSLSLLLYRMMRPRVAVLGLHSDTTLRDAVRHNLPPLHPNLGAIRFDGALRFVNVSYFEDALLKLERENPEIEYILVQSSGINEIDASGIEMLRNLLDRFKSSGIKLAFSGLKKQVSDVMDRTGLTDRIGQENIFGTDSWAIDELRGRLDGKVPTEPLP